MYMHLFPEISVPTGKNTPPKNKIPGINPNLTGVILGENEIQGK